MHDSEQVGREVSAVFEQAVGDAEPPLTRLVAGATADGRRIRRSRRIRVTGAAVAVAVLAVGGPLLLARSGATAGQTSAAASGPAVAAGPNGTSGQSGTAGPNGTAATAPAGGTSPTGTTVPLTGAAAVRTLVSLIPSGSPIGQYSGRDGLPAGGRDSDVRGRVVYDAGHGSAAIQVSVEPHFVPDPKDGHGDLFSCASRGAQKICHVADLPDGGKLLTWEGRVFDEVQRGADLLRADGVRVSVSTGSLMDAKHEQVLRQEPPLTLDQLENMALSPAWHARIGAQEAAEAAAQITPYQDQRSASATPEP
ncbi:hypothetical protein [Kitasatospora terrestris]|uniref:Uncharacterized protein n=1 Tax=Kitasatospora terrestris TaxID=258051 RepID=A0ABP9DNX4_9ACTN